MRNQKLLLAALVASICTFASAQSTETSTTDRLFKGITTGQTDTEGISYVRELTLREVALTVGAQAGLKDRSCEIEKIIAAQTDDLDARFRFNALMMGAGMLPPVISEAKDTVAIERSVMRIATLAYTLDEPATLVDVPPTWRNWLYLGLDVSQCGRPSEIPAMSEQMRPRDDVERRFVKAELEKAYAAGRAQAQTVFEANLARLERTYRGMRRYFELYERGMVSAPEILASTDVVSMDDPNVMVVGNTVIRITSQAAFVSKTEKWKPLAP